MPFRPNYYFNFGPMEAVAENLSHAIFGDPAEEEARELRQLQMENTRLGMDQTRAAMEQARWQFGRQQTEATRADELREEAETRKMQRAALRASGTIGQLAGTDTDENLSSAMEILTPYYDESEQDLMLQQLGMANPKLLDNILALTGAETAAGKREAEAALAERQARLESSLRSGEKTAEWNRNVQREESLIRSGLYPRGIKAPAGGGKAALEALDWKHAESVGRTVQRLLGDYPNPQQAALFYDTYYDTLTAPGGNPVSAQAAAMAAIGAQPQAPAEKHWWQFGSNVPPQPALLPAPGAASPAGAVPPPAFSRNASASPFAIPPLGPAMAPSYTGLGPVLPPGGAAPPTAAPTAAPVQIRSAEEYAALPSGTRYIDPDGNVRTKR
jgi:hypothetical protein